MAKSAVYKRGRGEAEFNMTPMIDVTFQLIIFFILAGQMASEALAKLDPPEPHESVAKKVDEQIPNRAIVNILSKDPENPDSELAGEAMMYKIENVVIEVGDIDALAKVLEQKWDNWKNSAYGDDKAEFFVEIRGHYTLYYREIQPVLQAAAKAEIPKMSITAVLDMEG